MAATAENIDPAEVLFEVTYFTGNERNVTGGQIIQYTSLKEMGDQFGANPKQGKKHNGYFVRGGLTTMYREDASLQLSRLLVIDADCGATKQDNAPPPKAAHEALVELGYNHFLYTTHSQSETVNKFRVVLEAERDFTKPELKPTMIRLLKELAAQGIVISLELKEMWVWSNPWFIPTRDDMSDGLFQFYSYYEGNPVPVQEGAEFAFGLDDEGKQHISDNDIKGWANRIKEIANSANYHENIRSIIYGMAKGGAEPSLIKGIVEGAMDMAYPESPERQKQWQDRYKDIGRIIQQTFAKLEAEIAVDVSDIHLLSDRPVLRDIPWPPGLMGELVEDCYMMMRYRHREIALVTPYGLLAGVVGRLFNVSNTGLNLYQTFIADSGSGKEFITQWISRGLLEIGARGTVTSSFLGAGYWTSAKAVANVLKDARCQISILTEAGFLMKTTSGNPASTRRYLLSLYNRSGYGDISPSESYSDVDNSIPLLMSPCLSTISESTPELFLEAISENNSVTNGEVPRQILVRLTGDKPYAADWIQDKIRPHCLRKLSALAAKCAEIQATDEYNVINMMPADDEVAADMAAHDRYWVDVENKNKHLDKRRSLMASRAHVKALKIAALTAVFNYDDYPYIPMREWQYAKDRIAYEAESIDVFFGGASGDIPEDVLAREVAGPVIVRLLTGELKGVPLVPERKAGYIRKGVLIDHLKKSKCKELNVTNKYTGETKLGAEIVLNHMTKCGWLVYYSNRLGEKAPGFKGNAACYKVTDTFKAMMQM